MLGILTTLVALCLLLGTIALVLRATPAVARRAWTVAFALVVGSTVTAMVAHAFVAKWAFKGDSTRDGLLALMDGTAERPYVYRRLTPDIVRAVTDYALPRLSPPAIDYLENRSPLRRYRWFWGGETWTERKAVAFHVAYAFTWLFLYGTLLAGAALYRQVRGGSWIEALSAGALIMALVPLTFASGGGYLYDAPELFLWTLVLFAAMRGWHIAVFVLFTLMLVNKESALLAAPCLFPFFRRTQRPSRAALSTLALVGVGAIWLLFVQARYSHRPGYPMAHELGANLTFWFRPKSYFMFSTAPAPVLPTPRGANVLNLILILLPARLGWRRVRPEVRQATVILAILLIPTFLVGGKADEIRALALIWPLLLIAVCEGVHLMLAEKYSQRGPL